MPTDILILIFMWNVLHCKGWMGERFRHEPPHKSTKTTLNEENHVCSLFIYTDPFLWRRIFYKEGGRNTTKTRHMIHNIIRGTVSRANMAFSMAEFYGEGHTIHKGINFVLADYYIDDDSNCASDGEFCEENRMPMGDMCHKPIMCDNMDHLFCNQIKSLRFYLHAYSSFLNHGRFCLSYAFTFQNMTDFQGIAWIKGFDKTDKRSFSHYGYCSIRDDECQNEKLLHYFRNTGVVNFRLVNGGFSSTVGENIFIHEIGHSFGSSHDDQVSDCNPQGYDLYLMTSNAKKILLNETTDKLSACSSRQIGRNLDKITCWHRNGNKDTESTSSIFSIIIRFINGSCSTKLCSSARKSLAIVLCIIVIILTLTSLGLCYCYRVIYAKRKRERILQRRKLLLIENEITSIMWSVDYGSNYSDFQEEQTEFLKSYEEA